MVDRAKRAYEVTAEAFRERLKRERPDDERELRSVESGEVVEVTGIYDRIATVLSATGMPFVSAQTGHLEALDWDHVKLLLINCPGQISREEILIVREWVQAGGMLLTTDWALKHVLEPAFPGKVRHNGVTTPDCVVAVDTVTEDPLLSGFLEDGRKPLWWLEGSSYPIEILDKANVQVLLESEEVNKHFGDAPVVVRWQEGEGEVIHMLSHLYLQRAETRDAKDRMSATAFFEQSGYKAVLAKQLGVRAQDLNAAELKRAYSSSALMAEAILRAKKRAKGKK